MGSLHRIHRGVYAVGHAGLGKEGRWKAATLALGEGAVLSHTSAAELWGMLKSRSGPVHVTVPTTAGRKRRPGINLHRSALLSRSQTTSRLNIPVTKPQRTLEDIRFIVTPGVLRRAIREAEIRDLPIDAFTLIPDRATSGLELQVLAICRRYRLSPPEVNELIGPYRVDFLWRAEGLVVEADSQTYHRGVLAKREDAERDRYLERRGFVVVRFTDEQIDEEPAWVAAEIRTHLKAAAPGEL